MTKHLAQGFVDLSYRLLKRVDQKHAVLMLILGGVLPAAIWLVH